MGRDHFSEEHPLIGDKSCVGATLLRSNFRIDAADVCAAVAALHDWAENYYQVTKPNFDDSELSYHAVYELRHAHSVERALSALGWDPVFDDDSNVIDLEQHTFDNVSAYHAKAMSSLCGIVRPGSFLIFHRDDNDIFKWEWDGSGNFTEQAGGRIVFGHTDGKEQQ